MDVLVLIDKLDDLVHNAKAVPLTDQVRIDREEIYDILDQMRATIPEEIKQARWIVKERQEMLAEAKRECDRILGEAREQAAREASQTEIVKLAERQAQEIIDEARRQARETRLEMEDWADGILSTLEVNLDKFLSAVKRGRERLHERSQENVVAGVAANDGDEARTEPARSGDGKARRRATSGLRCFGRRADARRQLLRQLDERLRRAGAAPVAVPGDSDQARRHAVAEIDHPNRRVGLVDGETGHDGDADTGGDEALDGPVVVRAEHDVRLAAGLAQPVLDPLVGAAGAVRDQRVVEQLA